MSSTIEPVPAVTGALLHAFRLPDVSGQVEIDDMTVEQCADFAFDAEQRLLNAARVFAQVCEPVRQAMAKARSRVDAQLEQTGGTKMMRATYDVIREQPKEKSKDIPTLLQLREILPLDVCAQVFSEHVQIKGAIDKHTLAALRDLVPDSMLDITVDANGTKLNKLLKDLGPESDAGKIIAAGYRDVEKGRPILKFVPRESALKKAI